MFGRKEENGTGQEITTTQSPVAQRAPAAETGTAPRAATPSPMPTTTRRTLDIPNSSPRRSANERDSSGERKLTVGKGLSLSGEITACDVLVVEGKVEAKLSDGKLLEITESGQFRGSVEIENADIAGRYDGQLTVHGRLTIRGTGRISGMVKYGELEVNVGGQIIGELQVVGGGAAAQNAPGGNNFKNAAKFTALSDDEDDLIAREQAAARKAS